MDKLLIPQPEKMGFIIYNYWEIDDSGVEKISRALSERGIAHTRYSPADFPHATGWDPIRITPQQGEYTVALRVARWNIYPEVGDGAEVLYASYNVKRVQGTTLVLINSFDNEVSDYPGENAMLGSVEEAFAGIINLISYTKEKHSATAPEAEEP